jgi:hypothetical protein
MRPRVHLYGRGCPRCHSSKGELYIADWLKSARIEFEEQKRFDDCKNKLPLPFDFWIPSKNLLIEFQGKQHFDGGLYYNKAKSLAHRHELDDLKRKYCISKGLGLLEITYKQDPAVILELIFNT